MKKIIRLLTACALIGATFLAYTGCTKDYDDDIKGLGDRLTAVESTLNDLKAQIEKGAVITNVETTADGVKVTLSDGKTFELTNGEDGAKGDKGDQGEKGDKGDKGDTGTPGSVVTIGSNGNWYIDGEDTGRPSRGEQGEKGDQGDKGDPGETGPAGNDAPVIYYYPHTDGTWHKVTAHYDEEGALVEDSDEATTDTWLPEGTITAVWNPETGELTLYNVEGGEGDTKMVVISTATIEQNIKDLASRIQSLVFVPEYSDGTIHAHGFSYQDTDGNTHLLSSNNILEATFQVTPAEYAANLNTSNTVVRAAQTKAAAAPATVAIEKITAREGGLVDVTMILPANTEGFSGYAIALYVYDGKVVEEGQEDADAINTANNISSDYAAVSFVDNEVLSYCLYKDVEGNKVLYSDSEDKAFECEWKKAGTEESVYTLYKGYEIGFKDAEGKYYSIAEVAGLAGVTAEEITPSLAAVKETKVVNKHGQEATDTTIVKISEFTAYTDAAADMKSSTPADMQGLANYTATITGTFTLPGDSDDVSVCALESTYKILNDQVTIEFAPVNVEWNYDLAVSLSPNKSNPYSENLNAGTETYESDYDIFGLFTGAYITSEKHILDGTEQTDVKIEIRPVENTKTAELYIIGPYNFDEAEPHVLTSEFKCSKDNIDYTVTASVTLGTMPVEVKIDLGSHQVDFTNALVLWSEELNAVETAVANEDIIRTFSATSITEDFKAELFTETANTLTTAAYRNETEMVSQHTKLMMSKDLIDDTTLSENRFSAIRISRNAGDIKSFSDVFSFEYKVKTWYGSTYTFTAEATVKAPEYTLVTAPAYVVDGVVDVPGSVNDNGVYTVQNAGLEKYFSVNGYDGANDVTVKFEILKDPEAESKGILNYPSDPEEANVDENGLKATTITWGEFTATEFDVKATIYVNGIALDTEDATKTITLRTRPVVEDATAEKTVEVSRIPDVDAVANLWTAMKITNNIEQGVNLVDQNATVFADIFSNSEADTKYGITLTFANPVTADVEPNQYDFSAENGTLTLYKDSATLAIDVTFTVEYTVTYNMDYNHKDAKTGTVTVVFKKNE